MLKIPSSARVVLALTTLVLAPACDDDPTRPPDSDTAADSGGATGTGSDAESDAESGSARARFHEDVFPILARHCGSCHVAGAVAPFAIDGYQNAVAWAEPMLAAIEARTMPPFAVNNDGTCNSFAGARWVSDEEIEIIADWVDAGYPEGDASIPPPDMPEPPALHGDIEELQLPSYEPAVVPEYGGFEDYHCFRVELDLDEPRYVTGFDVVPGNPELVHHVLGFRVNPDLLGNDAQMQALDEQSPDVPGWDCFGAAGEDVLPGGVPVTWAPGTGAIEYPEGTGVRFDPGDVLVVQVHYDLVGGSGLDATQVHLSMTDEVERQVHQVLWDPFLYSTRFGTPEQLPPGEEAALFSWDEQIRRMLALDVSGADQYDAIEVLGLIPHMHQRGRAMSIELETEAGMQCGADVDRWDFNWQTSYFFEQPIPATLDDRLHVTCEFDTSGDAEPVMPGFGTDDEMCLVGLMFAPA